MSPALETSHIKIYSQVNWFWPIYIRKFCGMLLIATLHLSCHSLLGGGKSIHVLNAEGPLNEPPGILPAISTCPDPQPKEGPHMEGVSTRGNHSWLPCMNTEGGSTTSCSEQHTSTAHGVRGTAASPERHLQMLGSSLPAGPQPCWQSSCFPSCARATWGQHMPSNTAPVSETACGHICNMSVSEEASQNQAVFCCDSVSPSVSMLQHSHCKVLCEVQRFWQLPLLMVMSRARNLVGSGCVAMHAVSSGTKAEAVNVRNLSAEYSSICQQSLPA